MSDERRPARVPREERLRQGAEQLARTKSDLHQSMHAQTLLSRLVEIVGTIEFVVTGTVSEGNPQQVPGMPAALLDDPSRVRVEFISGPGAIQQQRRRDEEARRQAALVAAHQVREAPSERSGTWFGVAGERFAAVRSAAATSAGSTVLVRDRVRELCETLDWMVASTSGAPDAREMFTRLASDLSPAVYPAILNQHMRTLVTYVEILLFNKTSPGEPRVAPGTPLAQIENAQQAKVEIGPVGQAEPRTRPEVQIIDRNSATASPALVELTPSLPQNDTQRVEFVDAEGNHIEVDGESRRI